MDIHSNITSFEQFAGFIELSPGNNNVSSTILYYKYYKWCEEWDIPPDNKYFYNRGKMKHFKCIQGRGIRFYKIAGNYFTLSRTEKEELIKWVNERKEALRKQKMMAKARETTILIQENLRIKREKAKQHPKEDLPKVPTLPEETLLSILGSIKDFSLK